MAQAAFQANPDEFSLNINEELWHSPEMHHLHLDRGTFCAHSLWAIGDLRVNAQALRHLTSLLFTIATLFIIVMMLLGAGTDKKFSTHREFSLKDWRRRHLYGYGHY